MIPSSKFLIKIFSTNIIIKKIKNSPKFGNSNLRTAVDRYMAKTDYNKLTKDQLIQIIKKLEHRKRDGLVWDEESETEQVVLDCRHKFPVLTEDKKRGFSTDSKQPTHILIEGDNYHALSVLNFTHRNKIDLIYIDPPYNTGKTEDFLYNDKYVDINDGYRHSKWLSFMNRRLELARDLLSEAGVIFIAIDDNEIAQLKLLCNKIFGEENFVAQFIRKNKAGAGHDSGQIAIEFDYMLCFAKNKSAVIFEKERLDVEHDKKYKLEDEFVDFRGKYYLRDLDYKGSYSESGDYPITTPDNTQIYAGGKFGKPNTWRWSHAKLQWGIDNNFIVFKKVNDRWKVYIKQYQYVDNQNRLRVRKLPHRALIQFLNSEGSLELSNIVPNSIFKFPKPTSVVEFCIRLMPQKDITILDFFAGSGTTGHAVLKVNAKDGGHRRFILCTNNENNICEEVTYKRIYNAVYGYTNLKGKWIEGLTGNLKYFRTTFIEDTKDKVALASDFGNKSVDLLCIKEGIFQSIETNQNYSIFQEGQRTMAVLHHLSDGALQQLKHKMDTFEGEKILYYLSADNHPTEKKKFIDWKNIRIEPIPKVILDVYKKLLKK